MPSLRRLLASKWSPALRWGYIGSRDIGPGEIEHEHMEVDYVEAAFGTGAAGALRQIQRLWVQDGDLFAEATDEF